MVSNSSINKSSWSDNLLIYPGMPKEGLINKRTVFFAQGYALLLTLTAFAVNVPDLIAFGLGSIAISSLASLIYIMSARKNLEWLIFLAMIANLFLSFYFIATLGGIENSAGLVLAGLILTILSFSLGERNWSVLLMSLYLLILLITAMIQPGPTQSSSMSQQENMLFFIMNILFAGGLIFAVILEFYNLQKKSALAEHARTDRVKELNRIKSMLTARISTHFQELLDDILFASEQTTGEEDKNDIPGLDLIRARAKKMTYLLNQMNEMSMLEAGSLKATRIQAEIIKYLRYIVNTYEMFAKTKGISIAFQSNTEQFNMDFDPRRTLQLFTNLLSGAINRTGQGGLIRVTVEREHEHSFKDILCISITDNGKVIPGDQLDYLIHPFQHDPDLHSPESSAELELAHSGALVNMFGGSVVARSNASKGSTIQIRLPAQNAAPIKDPHSLLKDIEIIPSFLTLTQNSNKINPGKLTVSAGGTLSKEHLN